MFTLNIALPCSLFCEYSGISTGSKFKLSNEVTFILLSISLCPIFNPPIPICINLNKITPSLEIILSKLIEIKLLKSQKFAIENNNKRRRRGTEEESLGSIQSRSNSQDRDYARSRATSSSSQPQQRQTSKQQPPKTQPKPQQQQRSRFQLPPPL